MKSEKELWAKQMCAGHVFGDKKRLFYKYSGDLKDMKFEEISPIKDYTSNRFKVG